eukprot:5784083-Prymnesium_polylepis.1
MAKPLPSCALVPSAARGTLPAGERGAEVETAQSGVLARSCVALPTGERGANFRLVRLAWTQLMRRSRRGPGSKASCSFEAMSASRDRMEKCTSCVSTIDSSASNAVESRHRASSRARLGRRAVVCASASFVRRMR